VTMVTTEVDPGDAGRYGVVQVQDGMVRDYAYKPDDPQGNLISNEVFVFRPPTVLDALDELAEAAGEEGLEDLGHELLPRLVHEGGAREHRFDRYWRDVGTVPAYWESHMELLSPEPPLDLDDRAWPILTRASHLRGPARLLRTATVDTSLVAPGALVAGTLERSVIGRGAVVEEGAVVRESVLLPGAVVRAGATVERAILDDDVEVGEAARVGEPGGDIALVGLKAKLDRGGTVPAGGRHPQVDE
jgi:glucose-1-phosphate adenylyltransferase